MTASVRLLEFGNPIAAPLLLIPGALTAAQGLLPVAQVLAQQFRVGVVDVSVPADQARFCLDRAVEQTAHAVQHLATGSNAVLVLGESAGGLIALELAHANRWADTPLAGLVLADPPLVPAKLWHVRAAMQQAVGAAATTEHSAAERFFADYARELFGYALIGTQRDTEPLYFDALTQCRVPVLILTGDEPLWPVRQSLRVPCLLDAQDMQTLATLNAPGLSVKRMYGTDHIHLRREPGDCMAIIQRWLRDVADL